MEVTGLDVTFERDVVAETGESTEYSEVGEGVAARAAATCEQPFSGVEAIGGGEEDMSGGEKFEIVEDRLDLENPLMSDVRFVASVWSAPELEYAFKNERMECRWDEVEEDMVENVRACVRRESEGRERSDGCGIASGCVGDS